MVGRPAGDGSGVLEYLLVQRPEKGLLAGLWEFPSLVISASEGGEGGAGQGGRSGAEKNGGATNDGASGGKKNRGGAKGGFCGREEGGRKEQSSVQSSAKDEEGADDGAATPCSTGQGPSVGQRDGVCRGLEKADGEARAADDIAGAAAAVLGPLLGVPVRAEDLSGGDMRGEIVHVFSHIRQTMRVRVWELREGLGSEGSSGGRAVRWLSRDGLGEAALTTGVKKVRELVFGDKGKGKGKEKGKEKSGAKRKKTDGQIDAFFVKRDGQA